MLTRLQYGDNVVWQVDDIAHYKELVVPYVNRAIAEHRKMVYIRFAQHAPLLEPQPGLTIAELDADTGRTVALRALWRYPDNFASNRQTFVVFHQGQQHKDLIAEIVFFCGRNEQTAVTDKRHIRRVQGGFILNTQG